MKIRRAAMADIPDISRIHALSWKTAYFSIVPQSYLDELREDFWVEAFQHWFENQTVRTLLAYQDGAPVGCVSYGLARDESLSGYGEIVSLYLLPEYFSKGFGRALMECALAELRSNGYHCACLWVLEENQRARRFYEKCGFSATSDRISSEIYGKTLVDIRYTIPL